MLGNARVNTRIAELAFQHCWLGLGLGIGVCLGLGFRLGLGSGIGLGVLDLTWLNQVKGLEG